MADQFRDQQEKVKRTIDSVNRDLQKRAAKKREQQMTGMIDSEIRGQLTTLHQLLASLKEIVDAQVKNPQA